MIVDSSALMAIVRGEPEAEDFAQLLLATDVCSISAPAYVESAIFPDRDKNPLLRLRFDELLGEFEMRIEPFTEQHARIAREAYRDYGKGSGHPAQLNLGDCFSYALARATGEELLFKGDDFIHTDLRPAYRSTT
jgi:ribonuclease VapC